jgi:hypothetical protein
MTVTLRYQMSDEHKERLAVGREQSRIVREYLNTLGPIRRGRKRTAESVERKLRQVMEQIQVADDPLDRLQLHAEAERLERELGEFEEVDVTEIEQEFVRVALAFSQRKGISYNAWRNLGVPASVLKAAGVTRSQAA